jgi:hypothetical protein
MVLYALFYVFLVLFIFFDSFKQESNKLELSGKEERKLGNGEDRLTSDSYLLFFLSYYSLLLLSSDRRSLWKILESHLTPSLWLALHDTWRKKTSFAISLFNSEQKRKGRKGFMGTVLPLYLLVYIVGIIKRFLTTVWHIYVLTNNDPCSHNRRIDPNRNAYIWFIRYWYGKKRCILQTREGLSKS